ncbi:hypothetical protein HCDSEM_126 [Candidatus Hodgkinia cicadicola Dsem]|nr:hypothetical protein HCDSEM_126 [Candidatus Hodgkinia cicadicola Dsem]
MLSSLACDVVFALIPVDAQVAGKRVQLLLAAVYLCLSPPPIC